MSSQFEPESIRWVALHEKLQDLLAGYADNELNDEQVAIVEAHLAGCDACRNDLARQHLLSERLGTIPAHRMSAALNQRLDQALADDATPTRRTPRRRQWQLPITAASWIQRLGRPAYLGASGWAVALVLVVMMLAPPLISTNNTTIPMVRDVVLEYNQMGSRALPVSANISETKLPANWPGAHLLATWKTEIGGAPAQAFALRSGHSIVFQFQIDESIFFRNPAVRDAVQQSGNYQTRTQGTDVMALPLTNAGLLLVGPADSLPSPEHLTFQPI